jgi:hypothetical protein
LQDRIVGIIENGVSGGFNVKKPDLSGRAIVQNCVMFEGVLTPEWEHPRESMLMIHLLEFYTREETAYALEVLAHGSPEERALICDEVGKVVAEYKRTGKVV